jgi:pimeloyl-ACP methyl ester carboxylesterase
VRFLPAIAFVLAVACCAPARLERRPQPAGVARGDPGDLARAFGGARDESALASLGRWIERAPRDGTPVAAGGFLVHFHPGGRGIFAPDYFDRLEAAAAFKVGGLAHHRADGAGVPLVGIRHNERREPVEKWYPPEGITRAVTAVVVPGSMKNGVRRVEVRLYDRMKSGSTVIGGKEEPLAADFTVPWAALLEETRPLAGSGITGMLRRDRAREAGFALMEEYDARRTPVILIHGLFSTPLAWAGLTNELWADPEVRKRYQIWHYLYPTNSPALYSARVMRGQHDELCRFLDPEGDDPAMRRSVVIAHSNGGLLAKSLAVEPRDAFWDAVFTRPLDQLDLTPRERDTLREAFYWKPRGKVDRVIFCSVPFRGSNWANSWVGRFGQRLIAPDDRFQDFFREIEKKNPGMFQPDYESLTRDKVTSVVALTPSQRSMTIFDGLPLTPGTAAHVITGSRDLFVAPSSSSFPGAESALEVPTGHGSYHHPKAVAEIRRILALPDAR